MNEPCKFCGSRVPGIIDHDGTPICYKCWDSGKSMKCPICNMQLSTQHENNILHLIRSHTEITLATKLLELELTK